MSIIGDKIAATAKRGLTASGFATGKSLCQKFARQCVQAVIGHGKDSVLQKASAKEAALSLAKAGIARKANQVEHLQAGDLLYRTTGSGGWGHVGVYGGDGYVYENSIAHWNGNDGRGRRSLAAFGAFQYVARFAGWNAQEAPAPAAQDVSLTINGVKIDSVTNANGRLTAGVREALEAAGLTVTFTKTGAHFDVKAKND